MFSSMIVIANSLRPSGFRPLAGNPVGGEGR